MRFLYAVVTVIFLGAPVRAWEAKASGVEKRLSRHPSPAGARQRSKPGWARKIAGPEDKVRWSQSYGGKTCVFGVGLARGIDNPGLRLIAAQDRARASLLEIDKTSGTLEGSRILDWYLDRSGDMYALAVVVQ